MRKLAMVGMVLLAAMALAQACRGGEEAAPTPPPAPTGTPSTTATPPSAADAQITISNCTGYVATFTFKGRQEYSAILDVCKAYDPETGGCGGGPQKRTMRVPFGSYSVTAELAHPSGTPMQLEGGLTVSASFPTAETWLYSPRNSTGCLLVHVEEGALFRETQLYFRGNAVGLVIVTSPVATPTPTVAP